jgi:hypothetical protein
MTKTEAPTMSHPDMDCWSAICGHVCQNCGQPGYVHKGDMACPVAK